MTRPSSRWPRSVAGGSGWGNAAIAPRRVLITADSGGSNSSRNRLWKLELQKFADATGMIVEVCHFPPGTSKWNKIEHRLFCHITRNWQGVPLETLEIVVNLIGTTRTATDSKFMPGWTRSITPRAQSHGRRNRRPLHPSPQVPRRMEL